IVQVTSLLAVLVLCLIRGASFPAKAGDLLASIVNGVVAGGAYLSFFTALRIGPVSVVSPVVAAYGGVTVVLAVLLRGETLAPLQAMGAALATGGVVLTGLVSDRGWRGTRLVGRGVVFALVAMTCFAILTIGLAAPIRSAGWLPVLLASRLANASTVWLVLVVVLTTRWSGASALLSTATDRPPISRRAGLGAAVAGGLLDIAGFVARDGLGRVRDRHEEVVWAALDADADHAAVRGVADGVRQEVREDLGEMIGVGPRRQRRGQ